MNTSAVIVSGSTGFIGRKLVNNLTDKNLFFIKRRNKSNYSICKLQNQKLEDFQDITLVHLATYFSKDKNKERQIYKGNIEFGLNLLKRLENYNLKKIIYTNTMFNFYADQKIRELYYTQTKKEFSSILENFIRDKNIISEEIFLDNTYGEADERKKIIPFIIKSIVNEEPNPVKNPTAFINLLHVDDVTKRLELAISSRDSGRSSFVEDRMTNIASIYEFLLNYYRFKLKDSNILVFANNDYLPNFPEINCKGIKKSNFENELVKCFDES